MTDINVVHLTGRLVDDAIFKVTGKGNQVTEFSLAVATELEDKPAYVPVDCWGVPAEMARDWQKGQRVIVHGRLKSILRRHTGGRHQQLVLVAEWVNEVVL